jgi:tape measure domain-containing protein
MAIEVGTAYVTIIPSAKGFASKLQAELAGELRRSIGPAVEGEGDRAGRSFGSRFTSGAKGVLSGLGGVLKTGLIGATIGIGAGLAGLTTFGLKSAASLEQTQISFNSLTGSVAKGQAQFKALQQFAAATPFEFTDLTTSAGRFDAMASAIGKTQDQLVPFLTTIGNVVSVTGGGAQNLDSVSLALSQITSRGKLTLDNINQLSNALPGFSGVAALAAVRGETQAKVMDEISAGTINASDGVNQLLKGMAQFPGAAGAMEKQSLTLLGVFSTFKDTIGQALSGAFQGVIPQIKDALTQVTPVIGQAVSVLAPAIGGVLASVLPLVGQLVAGLTPILTPLLNALGPALAALGPAIAPLGSALGIIAGALAPILPVVSSLIVALVQGLSPILVAFGPVLRALVSGVAQVITPLLPVIVQLGQILADVLAPVLGVVADLFTQLGPPLADIIKALAAAFMPLLQALAPLLVQLVTALEPIIPAIVSLLPPVVDIVVALTPLIQLIASLLGVAVQIEAPLLKLVAALVSFLASKAIVPLIELIAKGLTFILSPLTKLIGPIDKFGKLIQGIKWGDVGKAILNGLGGAVKAVGGFFADIGSSIGDFFAKLPGRIGSFFVGIGKSIGGFFAHLGSSILDFLKALPGKALAALKALPGLLINVLKNAGEGMLKALGFAIGLILGLLIGLPIKAAQLIGKLWDLGVSLFHKGVNAVVAEAKALPGQVVRLVTSLRDKAIAVVSDLVAKFVGFVSRLWTTVKTKFEVGVTNAVAFAKALPGRVVAAIANLGALIGSKVAAAWTFLKNKFVTGVSNAVAIAKGLPGKVVDAFSSLPGKITDFVNGFIGDVTQLGKDIIDGLVNGIKDAAGAVTDAIVGAVKDGWNAAKKFLHIGSPSKLYKEMGVFTVEGYAVGVEQHAPRAHAALVAALQPPTAATLGIGRAGTAALATAAVRATSNSWTINAAGTTIGVTELAAISARHDALARADRSD